MTAVGPRAPIQEVREPRFSENTRILVKRFVACLFGGFVLALMYNHDEGAKTDFGLVFHQAVVNPRIIVFLLLGVLLFAIITFWSLVRQYARRPGVRPMFGAVLVVVLGQAVMNWYDPKADVQGASKFSTIRKLVLETNAVHDTTTWFFDYGAWFMLGLTFVACSVAIVTRIRPLGYFAAVCGVAGAVLAWLAHRDILRVAPDIDHSLGVYADVFGFLIMAGAGLIAALSHAEVSDWRGFLSRVMDYRPGLPFAGAGIVLGLFAFGRDCWFAPLYRNLNFAKTGDAYSGTPINSLASNYLDWLGWTSFGVVAALAVAATYLRNRVIGWLAAAGAVAGLVITFFSMKSMTEVAAKDKVASAYGTTWNNLGAGPYLACIAFGLFAVAVVYVVLKNGRAESADEKKALPVTRAVTRVRTSSDVKAWILLALIVAVFYPATLSLFWQNVLVSQVSVFLLLAVGLNVVVGWAGLLDLGYIAFYAVGAYTTAYFTGSLPHKPPSWLHVTPLLAIPFAIAACLIAGVLLGAPTLRLRGDYLAIVTLAFGEIIQLIAKNDPSHWTNGPIGVNDVPHPSIHIGSFKITWGQDSLPYWYLLLVMLIIIVVLFYRLENSRLGRAWAAIREDEVAAQASGVNTFRAKILAFAIGASTSGIAGVFYASQIGFFDPSAFDIFTSILIVAYVVFGGMGSLPGAMAGAAVLTWLPEFLKSQVPLDDRQMWVGGAVLAMMIFRPAGLLPAKRRQAELSGLEGVSSAEVAAVPRGGAL